MPEGRFMPLGRADHLPGPFLPGWPVQQGVVDLAVADRRELEPDQAPGVLPPLPDLGEAPGP